MYIPPTGVVDLANLKATTSHDEHLAGIIQMAQANPDAYRYVIDDSLIEEAFTLGYVRALASFVELTAGGVQVPEGVLRQVAYLAYVDLRGMFWVSAMASTTEPPEEDLVMAYYTARKATEAAEGCLASIRDTLAKLVTRRAESEVAKVQFMTQPQGSY